MFRLNDQQESSAPAEVAPLSLEDLSFQSCLDRTELGEIWRVRTPSGKAYLCQILPHHDPQTTETLLSRLQTFRHPNLAPWMAVSGKNNRVALLSVLEGPTLADRLQEFMAAGHLGFPREELLGYLRQAALALDFLQSRSHVQHLWLHPRQLVIKDDRLQILAFGLAETWWAHANRPTAHLNPRYSAPDLLTKTRGPGCDQYSLALIFTEMVTGRHPWRGRESARNPDLALLTQRDREVIERALETDPQERFGSVGAMVDALEAATHMTEPSISLRPLVAHAGLAIPDLAPGQTLDQFIKELVHRAGGTMPAHAELNARLTLNAGALLKSQKIVGMAAAKLPVLAAFCRQWHGKIIRKEGGSMVMAIEAAPSFWQWFQGQSQGLEITVEFLSPASGNQRPVVTVRIKPFGCTEDKAEQLLRDLGPKVLKSLREYLNAQAEQRAQERLPLKERLQVCPVVNGLVADPIECMSKDVSAGGIGFLLPKELPASQVYLNLPDLQAIAPYAALAQVVRKQPTGAGLIEVGATFPITEKPLRS